jgi:hypothetical protein
MAQPGLYPRATFSRRCGIHLVERQILTRTFKPRHEIWPKKRLYRLRKNLGFVSGHDFSRAEND